MDLNTRRSRIVLSVLIGVLTLVAVGLAMWNSSLQARLTSHACAPSRFEGAVYFSQHYEDYILAQVFADTTEGTYVDVGANHPIHANNTAYLYHRGWHGITIEPNPEFAPLYARLRPRDTHLTIGAGDTEGKLTFHRVTAQDHDATALSTFDAAGARALAGQGYQVQDLEVPVLTLNSVLQQHPLGGITVLSVDVEGFERQVLQGIDLRVHRPTVVVMEASVPQSEEPTYGKWEPLLLGAGYVFAMLDGLNRYYVHRTHRELLSRFIHVDMCVKKSKLVRGIKLDGWQSF
jgi:FkbM family methyltransferase